MTGHELDVITIGRSSVDLYGQQVGGRLEDMASFAKSVGGSPTNIAVGSARLGLKAGLITRVGDEAMGRFIREQLAREGVDVTGVTTDAKRLTALVLLGIRDDKTFPLIFYRENCADMALDEGDIDEDFIARTGAIVVTGTHFSRPNTDAAQKKAIRIAKKLGRKVIIDIDYRPNLWGLAGHDAGEERFIASQDVTAHLQKVLPDCDLIVGTEEELNIAGGTEDALASIRIIRSLSKGVIVCKRGPMGCVVFPGEIPASFDGGIRGPGFPVEVYNVLGAGDGFMSGFLRGYLRDESFETTAAWANACGAFAVSRLMCSSEYPTFAELQSFLEKGSPHRALRHDATLNHIHWATTRRKQPDRIIALACDHRVQLEAMADKAGVPHARLGPFKRLAVAAAARVADGRAGFGTLIDMKHGREALFDAAGHRLWIGRPVEQPGSRPLRFETGADLGSHLAEWPVIHTVKALSFYHPDDPVELRKDQDEHLLAVHEACRVTGRDCLIEIIASKHGLVTTDTVARVLDHLYQLGIKPDWWKLEAQPAAAHWQAIEAVIARNDPYCRGIMLLGLDAPEQDLMSALAMARSSPRVKGFAIGRTVFSHAAGEWLAGRMSDAQAIDDMASRFSRLAEFWISNESAAP
jgi:5-dehydro-2-deoxygluconokinase